MAIRTVVTRGFGNGTFDGTIALVVTRGYTIGAAIVVAPVIVLPTAQPAIGFVKLRFSHQASAELEVPVELHASGRVIAHGSAALEIVPILQADGRVLVVARGATHLALSFEGHARGHVLKNTDAEDFAIIAFLDRLG